MNYCIFATVKNTLEHDALDEDNNLYYTCFFVFGNT